MKKVTMLNLVISMGFLILSACSHLRTTGVGVVAPVLSNSETILKSEGNYNFFKAALPSELHLLETLREQKEYDLILNQLIVQGYTSYGYGIAETELFYEKFSPSEGYSKWLALDCYRKSIFYGVDYLEGEGISKEVFWGDLDKLEKKLISTLDLNESQKKILLYLSLSLASVANLEKDKMEFVIHIPRASLLKNVACQKSIEGGVCEIFESQVLGSRPKMLGGDPEKALQILSQAKKAYPENFMIDWTEIEIAHILTSEEEGLDQKISALEEKIKNWREQRLSNLLENDKNKIHQPNQFFQALAEKKVQLLKLHRKNIF